LLVLGYLAIGVRPESTAGEEAWGEAVNGLRCRLAAERAEAPVGAEVVFQLHFRFDPEGVDPKINILNRFLERGRVKLTFADTKTGKKLERLPDDGWSGPPLTPRPEHFVMLRGKPLEPCPLAVRLLSPKGEPIPPGAYSVALAYENDGKPEVEFGTTPQGFLTQRPYKGPWKFWTGKVAAPPIRLTVVPAEAGEVEVRFHSALDIKVHKEGIGYSWSEKDPQTLRVTRRPGYMIGTRYETHIFLNGKEEMSADGLRPLLGGGMSSSTWLAGGESFLTPELAKQVRAGAALRIRLDVTIFETSVPPGHMWHPKGGDYKVLWTGVVEGSLPAEGKEKK
jgi:hypothetical protein